LAEADAMVNRLADVRVTPSRASGLRVSIQQANVNA